MIHLFGFCDDSLLGPTDHQGLFGDCDDDGALLGAFTDHCDDSVLDVYDDGCAGLFS